MATKSLIEKIEALPPDKVAEALFRRHGNIDTDTILRELREHGGR